MDRSFLRRAVQADADQLLEHLSQEQFAHPHASLKTVLQQTIDSTGVCPQAAEQALTWLQLDENRPIGRLRRTELTQLARSIHRHWRQNTPNPQPH
jgi:hypothetical protein